MRVSKVLIWTVAGFCALATIGLGVKLMTATPPVTDAPSRPGVIELASDPSFSPDGRVLAFVKNGADQGTLWLSEGDLPAVCAVTDAASVHRPVWSPDGRYVAYLRRVGGEFTGYMECTVQVLDIASGQSVDTGLGVTHLQFEYIGQQVQWSPDSTKLVACSEQLALWDVESGQATMLVAPGAKAQFASFSPSGRLIGYVQYEDGQAPLRIYDVSTGETRVAFVAGIYQPRARWTSAPEWLDESQVLIETENPDGSLGVTLVNVDTGSSQLLLTVGFMPQLSPDKTRFAFIAPDVWENDIYELSSGVVTRLPDSGGGWFRWSPDGTKLLIWDRVRATVFDAYSGQATKLLEGDAMGAYPSWAPDGKRVAVPGSVGNGPGTVLFGLEGGG